MVRGFCYDFLIDDKPLLYPDQNVEISENDLDASDTGRDQDGILHRIVVREGVRTWGFTYSVLDYEDYNYIRSLFKGKPTFIFSFLNTDTRKIEKVTAYCSKKSITLRNARTHAYKNLKFNIIEC